MRLRIRLALVLVLAGLAPAFAAQAAGSHFSLESLRRLVGVGSPQVSPDGRTVAFLVTKPDYDSDKNESELYVADLATGAMRAMTFERLHVSEPRWSPDGGTIAFLAPDAKDLAQVWLLPFRGGES